MKKLLPVLLFFFGVIFISVLTKQVYADTPTPPVPTATIAPTPTTAAVVPTATPVPSSNTATGQNQCPSNQWCEDAEVTFAGKLAQRANAFLTWVLKEHSWIPTGIANNSLGAFWVTIRDITYAFLGLFILFTAFIIIITRGKNITIMKFLPRFILILLLITFSFSLIQFIYQITDIFQGFFLITNGRSISAADLLNIAFNYADFKGLRLGGPANDESAFVTLLLVKLTAVTYFVMSGILVIRKVILWFFIILSPIFPLLLFYSPIRNTAKIWLGEFLRWLLYAPVFAVLLFGLVNIWGTWGINNKISILGLDTADVNNQTKNYPIAINILLSGPGQVIEYKPELDTTHFYSPDSFALYVVALIMLWAVILLPFLLLQIFLDYYNTFVNSDNSLIKQVIKSSSGVFVKNNNSFGPSTPPVGPPSPTAGLARSFQNIFKSKTEVVNPVSPDKKPVSIGEIPISTRTTGIAREIPGSHPATTGLAREIPNFHPTTTGMAREIPVVSHMPTVTKIHEERPVSESNTVSSVNNASVLRNATVSSISEVSNAQSSVASHQQSSVASHQQSSTATNQQSSVASHQQNSTATNQQSSNMSSNISNASANLFNKPVQYVQSFNTPAHTEVLRLTNLSVPTITDIARFESSTYTNTVNNRQEVSRVTETLQKIAAPQSAGAPVQQEHYTMVRNKLVQEQQKGNSVASSILSASNIISKRNINTNLSQNSASQQNLNQNQNIHSTNQQVSSGVTQNTSNATTQNTSHAASQATHTATSATSSSMGQTSINKSVHQQTVGQVSSAFPAVNRVQSVSLEDYEAVKKMWTENYQKLEPPKSKDGIQKDRKEWVKEDITKITSVVNLLSSSDPKQVQEGMDSVADILPFLLIGGFSQSEVIAYLKAKQAAAKSVSEEQDKKQDEEDTLLDTTQNKKEEHKEMSLHAEAKMEDTEDKGTKDAHEDKTHTT